MMDTVCGFSITAALPQPEFYPTLDLRIANVYVTAWQENQEQPIAIARAHFLLGETA
ncbi:MAG: hypothetical protein HOH02_00255 [Oceanospirillaceae bacterium]|jgi:acyl-coenzyme A thioesterase PaaI-like protein|nr:hypothetical protein [Oceanospirillaceae bacterium]MBT4442327.1 hypothetical protein [Oceanospirillaceae bacterium]MBT6076380.1 hypothetical protein [Oceanospirillaceae bacterium]MBT7330892.1 hypothetical protein [Oceanospirillaceae bacterium]